MAYTPDDAVSSLVLSPLALRELAGKCAGEFSIENIEAILFLMYIDSKVHDGQATQYEALYFMNEFVAESGPSQVNISAPGLRQVSLSALIAPRSATRAALLYELSANLADVKSRPSNNLSPKAAKKWQRINHRAIDEGRGFASISSAELLAMFNEIRSIAVAGAARKPYRSPFSQERPRNFLQRLFKR